MSSTTIPYLFVANGAAAKVDVPRGLSSSDWGSLREKFAAVASPRKSPDKVGVRCFQLSEDQRLGSAYWHEEAAGSGGVTYTLLPMESSSDFVCRLTKQHLRRTRDIVGLIRQLVITHWVDFPPPLPNENEKANPSTQAPSAH